MPLTCAGAERDDDGNRCAGGRQAELADDWRARTDPAAGQRLPGRDVALRPRAHPRESGARQGIR